MMSVARAKQTAQATEDISRMIEAIQGDAGQAVGRSGRSAR
jgi:methyl-accepting chemotaxis protein